MLNKKLFGQSFAYTQHFLVENKLVNLYGKTVELPVLYRLRFKDGKLILTKGDAKKPMVSRGNGKYLDGDWLVAVKTADKEEGTGLVLTEFNYITNLVSKDGSDGKHPDIHKLRKALETRGLDIEFTPCISCGVTEDLTVSDSGDIYCLKCLAKRAGA